MDGKRPKLEQYHNVSSSSSRKGSIMIGYEIGGSREDVSVKVTQPMGQRLDKVFIDTELLG